PTRSSTIAALVCTLCATTLLCMLVLRHPFDLDFYTRMFVFLTITALALKQGFTRADAHVFGFFVFFIWAPAIIEWEELEWHSALVLALPLSGIVALSLCVPGSL